MHSWLSDEKKANLHCDKCPCYVIPTTGIYLEARLPTHWSRAYLTEVTSQKTETQTD